MKKYFGGSHLVKKRKSKRPLDFTKLTHLVLRLKENQPAFFSPRDREIKCLVHLVASKYRLQIEELIFNHTHIHAVIAIKDRESYRRFIRELTSKIVDALSKSIGIRLKKIFAHRPFTRIVNWGRGLMVLGGYMTKNEKESRVLQRSGALGLSRGNLIKSGPEYWAISAQLRFLG